MVKIKRKVIQIADSTMLVSLPRQWIKSNNVKKGDELELITEGNSIKILSDSTPIIEEITVDVSGQISIIEKLLGALYKKGYDVINVTFSNSKELEKIHEIVGKGLIGCEIIDEKSNKVIIKSVSALDPEEFDAMLRRCFLFLISMSEDIVKLTKEGDSEGLKNIVLRDANINKITDFCRRSINKFGHSKFPKPSSLYCFVEGIEKIGDYYKDLAESISKSKTMPDKECIAAFERVSKYLRSIYNQFYDFKLKEISHIIKDKDEIMETIEQICSKGNKTSHRTMYYLETINQAIYNLSGPLIVMHI